MSGDHDKYHMKVEVLKGDGICLTIDEFNEIGAALDEAVKGLEEAVYLLNPTDEEMQNKAGVYRIVTALEKLKGRNA